MPSLQGLSPDFCEPSNGLTRRTETRKPQLSKYLLQFRRESLL